MKKKVLLLIALLLPLMANAQTEVNGVYYAFNWNGTAEVTSNPNGYYGIIEIPYKVLYRGEYYIVTAIRDNAFEHNKGITEIKLPYGINTIGGNSLLGCKGLNSISIPQNVKQIKEGAFAFNKNYVDFYCYAPTVPQTSYNAFYSTNIKKATLYVPEESIDLYKNSPIWGKFKKILPITTESWATEQYKKELAEKERVLAEARQKQIRDSIAAREKQIKDSIEAKIKFDAEIASAEKGDATSQFLVGKHYWDGDGVKKDTKKAIEYYNKAAEQGNLDAQANLGIILFYGSDGTEQNKTKAMKLINSAVAQGNEIARQFKENNAFWKKHNWSIDWELLLPNGQKASCKSGTLRTEHFFYEWVETGISKAQFDDINQQKGKLKLRENISPLPVYLEDPQKFHLLTNDEKLEIIHNELLSLIDVPEESWINIRGTGESGEYYKKGKIYTQKEFIAIEDAIAEKKGNELYNQLCKKYGKKYVDAIGNDKLLVGMPLDLITLKYWEYTVYRMKEWNNGESGEYKVKKGWTSYRVWTKNRKITNFRNWTRQDEIYFNSL